MRFRRLSDEELKPLEEELKQFLIVNHVHAAEWKEMNLNNPEQALHLIELFSDLVLEKVFNKMTHLLIFRDKQLTFFNVEMDTVERLDILSFNTPFLEDLYSVLNQLKANPKEFEVYFGRKRLDIPKADFVFQTMNNGAEILAPDFWHHFSLLLKAN
jgi:hypothetical protein